MCGGRYIVKLLVLPLSTCVGLVVEKECVLVQLRKLLEDPTAMEHHNSSFREVQIAEDNSEHGSIFSMLVPATVFKGTADIAILLEVVLPTDTAETLLQEAREGITGVISKVTLSTGISETGSQAMKAQSSPATWAAPTKKKVAAAGDRCVSLLSKNTVMCDTLWLIRGWCAFMSVCMRAKSL